MHTTFKTLLFSLFLFVVASAYAQNYAPAVNYPAQVRPRAVVEADFNGDGKPDLIVVNSGSNTLSFFSGNGDGTFTPAGTITLDGLDPIGLATGDFNADGKADLVVTYNDSAVQMEVLLGNGNGTFQPPIATPLPAPFNSVQGNGGRIVVADFDGNGAPDIAITGNAGGILVFLNTGGANFVTPSAPVFNTGGTIADFTVADFNNDGHLDIAFAANINNLGPPNRTVGLSLGNGNGTFQAPTILATGGLISGIAAADFDGDGRMDLVYTDPSLIGGFPGTINVGLQQANGSFNFLAGINSVPEPSRIITGDFNGDGNKDFAVLQSSSTLPSANVPDEVLIFLGNRDGTFQAPTAFPLPLHPADILAAPLTNATALDLAIADFSADEVSVLVNQGGNALALQSSKNPEPADQTVTFQAKVIPTFSATGIPSGEVIFADGAATLGVVTLNASGVASLTVQLQGQGTHTIQAVYGGDANFVGGASAILQQKVILDGSVPHVTDSVNPSNFGQTVIFMASVTPFFSGGSPNPTGLVTLVIDGSAVASATLDTNAQATFSLSTLSVGNHTVTVSYPGDTVYNGGISAPLTHVVQKSLTVTAVASSVNPSVFGEGITLTATVSPSGGSSGTPTGNVTFFDNGAPLGSGALNNTGNAILNTSSLSVGSHTITASYAGDANFLSSFGSGSNGVTQAVSKSPSATALTSSPNPSVFGQGITLSATVSASGSGNGTPTGTVIFSDNGTPIGNGTLNNAGVATLNVSSLSAGSHTITATYVGDANFLGSTASGNNGVTQTVNKSPSAPALTSTPNPSVSGQAVTLIATVNASAGGSGTPTGTVTFSDNGTPIGTGTLNNAGIAVLNISSLAVGSHTITAAYAGDSNFLPSSASGANGVTQTVSKSPSATTLSNSPNPSVSGQVITLTATVSASGSGSGTPTGTVTFSDNGTPIGTATLNNAGIAVLNISSLAVGSHNIIAAYAGDSNFLLSSASGANGVTQTVSKSPSAAVLSSLPNPSVSGQAITLTATVSASGSGSGTPTGSVTFFDNGTPIGTGILNNAGIAVLNISSLAVGSHTITAAYAGDTNFLASSASGATGVTQIVSKAPSTTALISAPNPSVSGQAIALVATVTASGNGSGTPTGTLTFSDNGTPIGNGTLNNAGLATLSISSLNVGSHTITAAYAGDTNFLASSASGATGVTQIVSKAPSTAALTSAPNPSVSGQAIALVATVTASGNGSGTPTGSVTFSDNGTPVGSGLLNNAGIATLNINSLAVGSHNITAAYVGDSNFLPSSASGANGVTQTVTKAPSATALAGSPNPSVFGQAVTLTATVSASGGGNGTPTGTVTFSDNGTPIGNGTLNNAGLATLSISSLNVGSHTITAAYAGDTNFLASSASGASGVTQTVSKTPSTTALTSSPNPSISGQAVALIATVTASGNGSGTPTGSVTFSDNGTPVGNGLLSNAGTAMLTISSLAVGSHTITVAYAGDSDFLPSSASGANGVTQTVSKSPSATALTNAPNPSVSGQAVTLTATVNASAGGRGTPTGTVIFSDNGTSIGNGTLNNAGIAVLNISSLAVGAHTITAAYAGDANFLGSSASGPNEVTQTVNKAPSTTAFTGSPNPSVFGQAVTLTATVSASGGGSGTPTGTVTFADNGTPIGNGTLNNAGIVTLTVSSLNVGSHNITASYAGDANFFASAASGPRSVTQIVNKSPSTAGLTSSINPSTYGQALVLTATVSPAGSGAGIPTGTVTFAHNGVVIGTAVLDNTGSAALPVNTLSVGSHTFTATYSGDSNFQIPPAPVVQQIVNRAGTNSAVAASINPSIFGQSVALNATVSTAVPGTFATGTITFTDNGNTLATVSLDNGGKAILATSSLAVGTHNISATYNGDSNFAGSQNAFSETVNQDPTGIGGGGNPQDFTITIQTAQASLSAGQTFTTQIALTPVNGLTGNETTFCAGLPTGATCSVVPNQATFDGKTAISGTLTITTTGTQSAVFYGTNLKEPFLIPFQPIPALALSLSLLLFWLIAAQRKRRLALATWIAVTGATAILTGCGGTTFRTTPLTQTTPAGTYTVTVQSQAGILTHSSQLTLIVK
jgi:Big-like domain-containing protein/VCBS repeat protein